MLQRFGYFFLLFKSHLTNPVTKSFCWIRDRKTESSGVLYNKSLKKSQHEHNLFPFSNDDAPSHICNDFSGQLHFRKSYFLQIVNTSSEQLRLQSNYFDTTVTFSEQLLFWGSYFFRRLTSSRQLFISV